MFVYIMIVAMFFALYFIVPQKYSAIPCVLFVLAMAVMSYFVQPGETDDLARYFYIISQIEKAGYEGFRQMLESNYFDFGSFPVCGYYFYFISILKNPHFLPFFTILICYGCIILVIQKASVKFKVDKFYTMLALIFAISTYWYYDVCSGTRNGIAFTVTVACAYYHLVERKNIPLCIIGYVLACGMHSSGIVLVGLVAIAWLSCNFGSRIVNAALILSLAGGSALLGIFGGMAKSDFMQSLLGKTENALNNVLLPAVYQKICNGYKSTPLFQVFGGAYVLYARHLAHKPAFPAPCKVGFANCCGSCLHGRYAASKKQIGCRPYRYKL